MSMLVEIFLGVLGTFCLSGLITGLIMAGPRVVLRWLLMLFKRKPEYVIVEYGGDYFPIKRDLFAYRTMCRTSTYGKDGWETQNFPQKTSIRYPSLYGFRSFEGAKRKIEELEEKEIKQVSSNGYAGTFWRGTPTFFEPKSYEPMKIGQRLIAPFKFEEEPQTVDGMIDAKFSDEEIMETKVGAERDLMASRSKNFLHRSKNNGESSRLQNERFL